MISCPRGGANEGSTQIWGTENEHSIDHGQSVRCRTKKGMSKGRRVGLAILGVVVFCAFAIFMLAAYGKTKKESNPNAASPASGQVSCLGRVVPGERVIRVTAASLGVVKELRVRRWDHVRKEQILAVLLDYDPSLASLKEAEARVAVMESQLARVKAGEKAGTIAAQEAVVTRTEWALKTARSSYERQKVLFDNDAISRSQYEDAELALEKAVRDRDEAKQTLASLRDVRPVDVTLKEKELNEARTGRDVAQAKLDLCLVRSPFNGQVIEINTYPGERIGQAGLLNLADNVLMVDAEVYVTEIRRVKTGARAVITGDGIAGEVNGTVTEVLRSVIDNNIVDPNPLASSDKRVIKARILVHEPAKVASLINSQVFVRILP